MIKPHQKHSLRFAYMIHRISGLLLALFLPAHFYVLGLALSGKVQLDNFLSWTDHPLVKSSELALVFLLAVHFFGGLRLLALEFLPWRPKQKQYAATAIAASFFIAMIFLLRLA